MSVKPSIFLSHSWIDKSFVRTFAERLVQAGVNVWLDEAEIGIGDSLVKKISEGIEQVDYVAAVISNESVKSEWVQKELSWAMTKEIEGQRVVVLPVVIERCELPGYLKDKLFAWGRRGQVCCWLNYWIMLYYLGLDRLEYKTKKVHPKGDRFILFCTGE